MKGNQKSVFKKIAIIIITILLIIMFSFFSYTAIYYHADDEEILELLSTGETMPKEYEDEIIFSAKDSEVGFIFYPGGKVEYSAYEPLMQRLADSGISCFIVKMPFNLAVFDSDAAAEIISENPEITSWYIGGHSLGGAMASLYASENKEQIDGLVLFAAYSTKDVSDLKVISIYGSLDAVLDREAYEENKGNLPADVTEYVIDGGNHAQFGNYGFQKGDNEATISTEQQIEEAAQVTIEFIK